MPETTISFGSPIGNCLREFLNQPPIEPTSTQVLDLFDTCVALPSVTPGHDVCQASTLLVLTTHGRAQSAARVLSGLRAACVEGAVTLPNGVDVLVLEDRSQDDYAPVQTLARDSFGGRLLWLRSKHHLGKPGFWLIYQAALRIAQSSSPEYVLFIQDDLEFGPELLSRALELMQALEPRRRSPGQPAPPCVLSLFSAADDERFGRWIVYPRHAARGLPVRQTQWFDLPAFVLNRAALELLRYRMVPIHPIRWRIGRLLSSGVGRQLTRRLSLRAKIYQCFPPLVFHGLVPSQMNPEARTARVMDNRGFGTSSARGRGDVQLKERDP